MVCSRSGANGATLRAPARLDWGSLGHRSAPSVAARILARMVSTSSSSPWRMPDSSWLTPPIECTGTAPFDRQPDVVDHLAGVELVHEHLLAAGGGVGERVGGERPQRDRAERADRVPLGAQLVDDVVDERAGGAERHDEMAGAVDVRGDVARLDAWRPRRTCRRRCASAGRGRDRACCACRSARSRSPSTGRCRRSCRRAPTACREAVSASARDRARRSSGWSRSGGRRRR